MTARLLTDEELLRLIDEHNGSVRAIARSLKCSPKSVECRLARSPDVLDFLTKLREQNGMLMGTSNAEPMYLPSPAEIAAEKRRIRIEKGDYVGAAG